MTVKCFGEVLWDLLPDGKVAGGAPMNVAVQLNNFGVNAEMISRIGKDELGEELLSFLKNKGMDCHLIQKDDKHGTGVVTVYFDNEKDVRYTIEFPAAWDYIETTEQAKEDVTQADAIVFGSLACRNDISRNTLKELLKTAKIKIFDVNLRPPHYTKARLEELMSLSDIVKMNDTELILISEWYMEPPADIPTRMKFLRKKYNLKALVVTLGANGAAMVTAEQYVEQGGTKVTVQDTVGSGDAFLAGFIYQLLSNKTPQEQLQFACVTGALVATYKGGTPSITEEQVKQLYS